MRFEVPLKAIPKGRPQSGRQGFFYTPQRTRVFEEEFRFHLQQIIARLPYKAEPLTGRLEVTLELLPDSTIIHVAELKTKRTKGAPTGDIDNLEKMILDSCNGLLWEDDRQIDSLWAKR